MVRFTELCTAVLATSTLASAAWLPFGDAHQSFKLPFVPALYPKPPQYTTSSSAARTTTTCTGKVSSTGTPASPSSAKAVSAASSKSSIISSGAQSSAVASSQLTQSSVATSRGIASSQISQSPPVSSQASRSSTASSQAFQSSAVISGLQSSSAAASTQVVQSSASVSATSSDDVISVSGCPPITVSTSLKRIIPEVCSATTTSHYPPYVYTYVTGSFASTSTLYGTNVTSYTKTTTYTEIVVSSPTTTVTVPTSPGFTPVLCEEKYYEKTTTVTNGNYYVLCYTAITDTALAVQTLTSYTVTYTDTTTTSVPTGTITTISTSTITETRSNPTKTVYDACGPKNIASKAPDGGYFFYTGGTSAIRVTAVDPVDCCELCQANSSCVSSVFLTRDFLDPLPKGAQNCVFWGRRAGDPDVCNATYSNAVTGEGVSDPGPFDYISNSGCGQYDLAY